MKPLIKYPGGKEKELAQIIPNLPKRIDKYYEPFVGGGSVFFALSQKENLINDKSEELIDFYKYIKSNDTEFYFVLKALNKGWYKTSWLVSTYKEELIKYYFSSDYDALEKFIICNDKSLIAPLFPTKIKSKTLINLFKKTVLTKYKHIKKTEAKTGSFEKEDDLYNNIMSAFKAGYYTVCRDVFNKTKESPVHAALYVFIREYCYSSMFRYNKNGEFNAPYGGISYNEKYLDSKITAMRSKECSNLFSNTTIECMDFYDFMKKHSPKHNDFIFLDPPYDSDFSNYANNIFEKKDQERLRDYLVNECKGKWMVIIKNTDFVYNLYNKPGLYITMFDKNYQVSFKNRNDKKVKHLLITNYPTENEYGKAQ